MLKKIKLLRTKISLFFKIGVLIAVYSLGIVYNAIVTLK